VIGVETVDEQMADDAETLIALAMKIDEVVTNVVAENTLNPAGIDAGIRKGLLPDLFKRFGLDNANAILDQVVHIVRVGLSRD